MQKILYVGWLGFDNVGDELMWDVFREECRGRLPADEFEIVPSIQGIDPRQNEPYDWVVLGGGSLIMPPYIEILRGAQKLGKKTMIWGSGIDWLPIHQIALAGTYPDGGYPEPDQTYRRNVVDAFGRCEFAGVRGPLTMEVLRGMGVDKALLHQCGDPGLLARPDDSVYPMDANMWEGDEPVIAVNWGTSYQQIYGGDEKRTEAELAKAIRQLVTRGYRIYLYHVWGVDEAPCIQLMQSIGCPDRIRMAPRLFDQYEIMSLLRKCFCTVNFKLHPSVLSTVVDVPFIALGYRFKVFDFAASMNLASFVQSTDAHNLGEWIVHKVSELEANRGVVAENLKTGRERYQTLIEESFRAFMK
jgi:hypothetical protein